MRRPSLSPGPRKLLSEVRFALSYEALKTYGTLSLAAMALIEWAILSVWDSLSITHGPAIRKSSAPARKPFTSNWLCDDMSRLQLAISNWQRRLLPGEPGLSLATNRYLTICWLAA